MLSRIRTFIRDENGATAIEYGLIAALLSIVIIGTLTVAGGSLDSTFQSISNALSGAQ